MAASSHHAEVWLAGARKLGNHSTDVSCPPAQRLVAEHHAPRHAQANRCPCRESARHGVAPIRLSADTSLRFVSLGTTIGWRTPRAGAARHPGRRAVRARLPGPLLPEKLVFWKSRLRRALITSSTPRTIRTPQLAHAAPNTVACAGNQPGTVALTIGCAVRARITRQQSRLPAPGPNGLARLLQLQVRPATPQKNGLVKRMETCRAYARHRSHHPACMSGQPACSV